MHLVENKTKAKLRQICRLIAFLDVKYSTRYERRVELLFKAINDNDQIRYTLFEVIQSQ